MGRHLSKKSQKVDSPIIQFGARSIIIASIYAVISGLWIFLSDRLLFAIVRDADVVAQLSVVKGIFFVSVTSLLLLVMMWRGFGKLDKAVKALQQSDTELKRSRAQLSAVIQSARNAILTLNDHGDILSMNPAAESMFVLNSLDSLGRSVNDLLVEPLNLDQSDILQVMGKRSDGVFFPAELSLAPVHWEGAVMYVVIIRDVSDWQEQQRKLTELNEALETRVSERTSALEKALIDAESADRAKSTFMATMSHELKTPLNAIIGYTSILLQGMSGPITDVQKEQLSLVKSSSNHLLELINDILELSRIQAGESRVDREAFSLNASVSRVVDLMQPIAQRKGIHLRLLNDSQQGRMLSNKRRLEQILLNLINNAIKFTYEGEVTVVVEDAGTNRGNNTPAGEVTDVIRIRVQDTGIGIREQDMSKLFVPFSQIDSGLDRDHDGSGLGLSICLGLAQILGGEIKAKSEWQKGSEFIVTLPTIMPEQ
ncbi:PAS domain-containing sensor histidine kinase [Pseudohongiella nitratireducens]|uniref:PAS domain-containing sensor histidine kinase n=1 Tax=Pseudohongiella nitratireducens TaxID=1768907 RepID=UPI0030ED5697|tara:strand:- start:2131 stop:3582 length:1452 start_codon:yes stop_codon:yes gene_type:complete